MRWLLFGTLSHRRGEVPRLLFGHDVRDAIKVLPRFQRVHELATNAAKYGALSSATGQIAISWSLSDGRLNFEWRESGGPVVSTPTKTGFGMRLLSQALTQFGGVVATKFEATGLLCKISVTISDDTKAIGPDNGSAATVTTKVTT